MDTYKTDDEQAETLKRWLSQNGMSLLTGLLLGLSVLFGYKAWNEYSDRRSEAASNIYMQFSAAAGAQNEQDATRIYEEIIKDFAASQYAVLAALYMAKLSLDKDDLSGARGHLQWAYEHAEPEELKHSARLRLARVLLGSGDIDAAATLIQGVTAPHYSALYEELRGDIARASGDMDKAHAAYERALAALPENVPGRSLIEAKRDDSVHTVTPPVEQPS